MTNDALLVLRQLAMRGELTPEKVVEVASKGDSPLHELFEWDDALAAHAHRLQQARSIIRSVRVEITVESRTLSVPAYVHDPERDETGGYVETLAVVDDRSLARRVLHQELARAVGCLDRAKRVASALGMSDQVESLIQQMMKAQDQIKEPEDEAAE